MQDSLRYVHAFTRRTKRVAFTLRFGNHWSREGDQPQRTTRITHHWKGQCCQNNDRVDVACWTAWDLLHSRSRRVTLFGHSHWLLRTIPLQRPPAVSQSVHQSPSQLTRQRNASPLNIHVLHIPLGLSWKIDEFEWTHGSANWSTRKSRSSPTRNSSTQRWLSNNRKISRAFTLRFIELSLSPWLPPSQTYPMYVFQNIPQDIPVIPRVIRVN